MDFKKRRGGLVNAEIKKVIRKWYDKSDAILNYVFYWNTTRYMAKKLSCATSLVKAVQQRVRAGGDFYESLGYFEK